jgi:hypothetical protein
MLTRYVVDLHHHFHNYKKVTLHNRSRNARDGTIQRHNSVVKGVFVILVVNGAMKSKTVLKPTGAIWKRKSSRALRTPRPRSNLIIPSILLTFLNCIIAPNAYFFLGKKTIKGKTNQRMLEFDT